MRDRRHIRVLGRCATVAGELSTAPFVNLARQEGCLGAQGNVSRVDIGRGELVMLGIGWRMLRRAGRVLRLRRSHVIEIDRAEAGRFEERRVEVVALVCRGREEGEVAVGKIGREEALLGLGGEGQVVCARGCLLGEAGGGVKGGRVDSVSLERLRLLPGGLSCHEAVGKGRVEARVGGKLLLCLLVERQVDAGVRGRRKLVRRRRVRLIYNRPLRLACSSRRLAVVLRLVVHAERG